MGCLNKLWDNTSYILNSTAGGILVKKHNPSQSVTQSDYRKNAQIMEAYSPGFCTQRNNVNPIRSGGGVALKTLKAPPPYDFLLSRF